MRHHRRPKVARMDMPCNTLSENGRTCSVAPNTISSVRVEPNDNAAPFYTRIPRRMPVPIIAPDAARLYFPAPLSSIPERAGLASRRRWRASK